MRYLVIDTETSGLPRYDLPAEHPEQPRLCSLALIFANDLLQPEREPFHALIKPEDWTFDDNSEAARVNGFTHAQLTEQGVSIRDVLDLYSTLIRDERRVVIAHNARMDCKMLRGELRRAGLDDLFELTQSICTMRAMVGIAKLPRKDGRPGYKTPKLWEAYKHWYGEPPARQHSALADAYACFAVARKLFQHGLLPAPEVHRATEGSKAYAALQARQKAAE